jgi:hypothetical protein
MDDLSICSLCRAIRLCTIADGAAGNRCQAGQTNAGASGKEPSSLSGFLHKY